MTTRFDATVVLEDVAKMAPKRKRVTINISGHIFETYQETLEQFPETLLARLGEQSPHYCSTSKQYFFDRSRLCFESILFFYQSRGILSCPIGTSITQFEDECLYFGLPRTAIKDMMLKEGILAEFLEHYEAKIARHKNACCRIIWDFFDNPESSKPAMIFALFSMLAILGSIVCSCIDTVPDVGSKSAFALVEGIFNYWFLTEFTIRFVSSPSKKTFLLDFMNWVDAIAIIPYFIMLAFTADQSSFAVLRITRLIRIVRIFRLSKQWKRLRAMLVILNSCMSDIQNFLVCFLILMVFGASVVYFTEGPGETTGFESVPAALWWAAASITTVGYGDVTPDTALGQFLALIFIILGIVTISLPILQINARFAEAYEANFTDNVKR